jgi:hypothetical protein
MLEVSLCVLLNEHFQISLASLLNPKFLVGLECLLIELTHESEAGPLVEEIKLCVVFVALSSKRLVFEGLLVI